ncbi:hypothetical protein [Streptomyces sp. LaPpAH-108]|uniref:hypothetical protein n=1 Tax=Streptomyces sp. LaPpAH-108 TaxID=1155714 RepID=UPI001319D01B|nr:hypothetical protein [Streptomyces sp. LaPpAH-108]
MRGRGRAERGRLRPVTARGRRPYAAPDPRTRRHRLHRTAALVAASLLCALSATRAGTAEAAPAAPQPYAFAPGAESVSGEPGTSTARPLKAGHVYRSALPAHGKLYYRLDLAAKDTAYVPVTAVPPTGTPVASTDGIRVSLRDLDGNACSYASATIGGALSPRPVTALAQRDSGRTLCGGAGAYYLLVERVDGGDSGSGRTWDLEIAPVTEARRATTGPTTPPATWDSATPRPPVGTARTRAGGAGFATARLLGEGIWRTRAAPGATLFYAVPVDWGQQLHATAELGAAPNGNGYVGGALDLTLHNPARGRVENTSLGFTGTPHTAVLPPVPPVEYANRYAVPDDENTVRFAGRYYLVVHVSSRLADSFGSGSFEVTLTVRLDGHPHDGPRYAGKSVPDDLFTVSSQDRQDAVTGESGDDGTTMRVLAAGGIGTGTALLLGLGAWTLVARRAQTRTSAQKPTA